MWPIRPTIASCSLKTPPSYKEFGSVSPWLTVQQRAYRLFMERHEDLAAFATVVRTFRRAAGYTQEGFAHEARLDRGFVGAVERGERNVGFRKIRQLLVGLGIDWRDLGIALQEVDPLPRRASGRRSRSSA